MSHILIAGLSLLLLLSGGCTRRPAPPKDPATQTGPWSLKFTTSGGFAGVGIGSISVDSDGKFDNSEPMSPQKIRKGCTSTLRPRQLEPISEAVAQAKPEDWNRSDLDLAAPDAFSYKLELRMGSDAPPTTVQWYDNTKDRLPADLKHLSEVLMQTMKTACHPGPP
jgi:hypothetical protein